MKKYICTFLTSVFLMLFIIASYMILVDPVFHYHKPIKGIAYKYYEGERYINDGITKNWDYNAIITGTSMTENFKTSEFDALFNVKSIKVPFAGAHYKEINDNLKEAFKSGHDVDIVIRCIDTFTIIDDKDASRLEEYPLYLTNSNPFDDVKYWYNKEIILDGLKYCILGVKGEKISSMDDYSSWDDPEKYGKDRVLSGYNHKEKIENKHLTKQDIKLIDENIDQNIISTIKEHPNCQFYLFFQPSSVLYYDYLYGEGLYYKIWEAKRYVVERLVAFDNVKFYGWDNKFDITTNLDYYRDISHYSGDLNSKMLEWIRNDNGLINNTYGKYFDECIRFYETYDYNKIFQE